MPSELTPTARSWRRYLRLSMRGIFVVVLLFGGWLGWVARGARIQREAVAAIKRAGGVLEYDSGSSTNLKPQSRHPWAPKYLLEFLGIDYFAGVSGVYFPERCSDAELLFVGRLTQLQRLYVLPSSVSDTGLAHLSRLSALSELCVDGTQVTDAGLIGLKAHANLTHLNLNNTRVSDAGLPHLKALTKLSTLMLSGTQVTDAGVEELKRALPNLTIYR
jgi:Leucine-rich repeat (LRR) protein